MFPPRSLICSVTIASPSQTVAKTPEKTSERWSSRAFMLRRKESRRQKSRGPLRVRVSIQTNIFRAVVCLNIPQIPIPQPLAHPTLQHRIRIRPPADQPLYMPHGALQSTPHQSLRLLSATHPTTTTTTISPHHPTKQVLRIQHQPHLLPHAQQIPPQRLPHRLVERAERRPAVFAGDRGVEVSLRGAGGALVGVRLRGGDVAG